MRYLNALALLLALGCGDGQPTDPDLALEADGSLAMDLPSPEGPDLNVNAPAVEVCNGLDDDGDGEIDEELGLVVCGLGECRAERPFCLNGEPQPCVPLAPGPEICSDLLDNNCNGEVDEGCLCQEGESRECGQGEGLCEPGRQSCEDGLWGSCLGSVGSQDERCDNLDNDCDGAIDEGCPCQVGKRRSCGSSVGICSQGWQDCLDGLWTACVGQAPPQTIEPCDGLDNDCDGEVDEGCPCANGETRPCGSGEGACKEGTQWCLHGVWGACYGAIDPQVEDCDGVDNDCDGLVDEGFAVGEPCGVGACRGVVGCEEGEGVCLGALPEAEVCNGLDDDCDGQVDEEGSCLCLPQEWAEVTCHDGRDNDCDGLVDCGDPQCFGPHCQEVCGDGWDNDGNGLVDDGCLCEPGSTLTCPLQAGVCQGVANWCTSLAQWNGCFYGAVYQEQRETSCSDGLDNDCDGREDCLDADCLDICGRTP